MVGYHRAGSSPASATHPKRPVFPRKQAASLRLSRGFPRVLDDVESCVFGPDECKSVQKLTLSGEYDGTRNGTFFEQLGTTGGTAKMRNRGGLHWGVSGWAGGAKSSDFTRALLSPGEAIIYLSRCSVDQSRTRSEQAINRFAAVARSGKSAPTFRAGRIQCEK